MGLRAGPRGLGARHQEAKLYEALRHRHSSRFPFTGPPVPYVVRDEITAAATAEDTHLAFLRRALRDPRQEYVHVQMVMRFGYGPQGPATPRRPVTDVLDTGT